MEELWGVEQINVQRYSTEENRIEQHAFPRWRCAKTAEKCLMAYAHSYAIGRITYVRHSIRESGCHMRPLFSIYLLHCTVMRWNMLQCILSGIGTIDPALTLLTCVHVVIIRTMCRVLCGSNYCLMIPHSDQST
jgi:hypothetical protein